MEDTVPVQSFDATRTLLTPREAALYLGLSESTLARLRSAGSKREGPVFSRLGGSIRYAQRDLDAWVERNKPTNGRASENDAESGTGEGVR